MLIFILPQKLKFIPYCYGCDLMLTHGYIRNRGTELRLCYNCRRSVLDGKNVYYDRNLANKGIGRTLSEKYRKCEHPSKGKKKNVVRYCIACGTMSYMSGLRFAECWRFNRDESGRIINMICQSCYNRHIKHKMFYTWESLTAYRKELTKYRVFPKKDTSIEIKLQGLLRYNNINFETHKPIFGQPDLFIEPNICIFADGDYWHNMPKMLIRDQEVNDNLTNNGYCVLRISESVINNDLVFVWEVIKRVLYL